MPYTLTSSPKEVAEESPKEESENDDAISRDEKSVKDGGETRGIKVNKDEESEKNGASAKIDECDTGDEVRKQLHRQKQQQRQKKRRGLGEDVDDRTDEARVQIVLDIRGGKRNKVVIQNFFNSDERELKLRQK